MAALSCLVALMLVLCYFHTGRSQDIAGPTQITISPTSLVMSPNVSDSTGGQVTVTCRPTSAGTERLVVVIIERVLHKTPNAAPVSLAGIDPNENGGNAVLLLQSLQGSASVGGSISQRSVSLTLNRANCDDAGMYFCKATTFTADYKTKIYSNSANLTIQVSPGEIVMTAEPSGTTNWRVNDTLLMRCNGIVGTVIDQSQIAWVWEYQDGTLGYDNWRSYSSIGNPDTDINNQGLTGDSNCYKYQISELTRHLTLDDTGRQYRCYVINRDVTSQIVDFAQVYDVGNVTESDVPVTEQGTTAPNSQPFFTTSATVSTVPECLPTSNKVKDEKQATCNCPDVGAIIGAVVAVLIVIDVIILAVVIVFLRRRMLGGGTKSMSRDTGGSDRKTFSPGHASVDTSTNSAANSSLPPSASDVPPSTYDRLNTGDVGMTSVYQDLSSPYEIPR